MRNFLIEEIGSAERLDVLLSLYRQDSRWRAADALATELGMAPHAVQGHLEALSGANLLDVRVADEVKYTYRPGRPELAQSVRDVARAHYDNRNEVLAVLAGCPPESARLFASAFRLRTRGKK